MQLLEKQQTPLERHLIFNVLHSCQQVEVCQGEVTAVFELVIHYLANRNHVLVTAALQKKNYPEWRKSYFLFRGNFLFQKYRSE